MCVNLSADLYVELRVDICITMHSGLQVMACIVVTYRVVAYTVIAGMGPNPVVALCSCLLFSSQTVKIECQDVCIQYTCL